MKEYLGNPKNTIEIIQKYEFMFQKKFGQNFLIDTHVLEKIINAAGVTKDDCVLEIGPGIGTMTQYLAENARQVVAVEIDRNLIPILGETLAAWDNVTIINEDILKVDIRKIGDRVPSMASPVLFTDLAENMEVRVLKKGQIHAGEPFMEVHRKADVGFC